MDQAPERFPGLRRQGCEQLLLLGPREVRHRQLVPLAGDELLLEQLGCTVYNPNTDCPQKPGDEVKGASNWLEEFRKSLKLSVTSCGFVMQMQQDASRERSTACRWPRRRWRAR